MKRAIPSFSAAGQDRLRRRFTSWSLAILSTMAGTAAVSLSGPTAWCADDPPAESGEKEKKPSLTQTEFIKLLQTNKLDELAERVDALRAAEPTNMQYISYEANLASALCRAGNSKGTERFTKLGEELDRRIEKDLAARNMLVTVAISYSQTLLQQGKSAEALQLLDSTKARLAEVGTNPAMMQSLGTFRIRALIGAGRLAEAKVEMDKEFDDLLAKSQTEPARLPFLINQLSLYTNSFQKEFSDAVEAREKAVAEIVEAAVAKPDAGLPQYQGYLQLTLASIDRLANEDAKAAREKVDALRERVEKFKENLEEAQKNQLQALLTNSLRRIEATLKHAELIGAKAPEFDAQNFIGMDATTMAGLKGKVVLIDFWAVWCGPCIATFPHLKEWHKEFSDKGLVIVGVTREYGYAWDADADRATRKEGTTTEEELAMLEKFRAHHELGHGFIVTPKGSKYNDQFGVSGIPQAVLIDQDGVIRMVKVGSGDANAHALEEEIKKLLSR